MQQKTPPEQAADPEMPDTNDDELIPPADVVDEAHDDEADDLEDEDEAEDDEEKSDAP